MYVVPTLLNVFNLFRKIISKVIQCPKGDNYNGNRKLPVYSRSTTRFDTQEAVNILLDPELDKDKICKMQPTNIEYNAAFVVDVSNPECLKDLYCDDRARGNVMEYTDLGLMWTFQDLLHYMENPYIQA